MENQNIENEITDSSSVLPENQFKGLRLPTIRRFPRYLRLLWELTSQGRDVVSSDKIALELNMDSITVRKDLAFTGVIGKPRIGYSIPLLIKGIELIIKSDAQTNCYLIGAGSLGKAMLGYTGFEKHGYHFIAAFDSDPVKIGSHINGKPVLNVEELPNLSIISENDIAILCVPEEEAQRMADIIVKAGIKAIWNFTSIELKVPDDVTVQMEDLASSLAVLSINMKKNLMKRLPG